MDDIWLHNVKMCEIFSESIPQLALNLWVIKIYGISDPIQLLSALLAWIGHLKTSVDRLCFIRNGEDVGMASWNYVKSLFDLIIPFSTGFIGYLIGLSEDSQPAWSLLVAPLLTHPIISWIVSIVSHKRRTPNTKSSSIQFTVY